MNELKVDEILPEHEGMEFFSGNGWALILKVGKQFIFYGVAPDIEGICELNKRDQYIIRPHCQIQSKTLSPSERLTGEVGREWDLIVKQILDQLSLEIKKIWDRLDKHDLNTSI